MPENTCFRDGTGQFFYILACPELTRNHQALVYLSVTTNYLWPSL